MMSEADLDLDRVAFRRVQPPPTQAGAPDAVQVWDMVAPGGSVFARAELFPGAEQWGVRLQDRAPRIDDADLLRLVGRLLVWEAGCTAETVDVVLGRTHAHHPLVRVGGEYV